MKDKLEPNMYVRTNKGIAKIIDRILEPDHYYFKMWVTDKFLEINDDAEYISEVDVLKASHNIIDLIEVGDYVNGYKVSFKGNDYQPFVQCDYPVECGQTNHYRFYEKAIYSIVTKKQFSSMEYKLGD